MHALTEKALDTTVGMTAMPLLADAGITISPSGAATHRTVARWLWASERTNAFAVSVGPTLKMARPEVVTAAGSWESKACGVIDEPAVPAVVQRWSWYSAALSAGVAAELNMMS